ncbi:MAG: hypothetical protein U0452_05960 [Anaerolineae bacterium]
MAGRELFREVSKDAGPVLLAIMDLKITVPESMMGDILGDLNTRRARVQGMDTEGSKMRGERRPCWLKCCATAQSCAR